MYTNEETAALYTNEESRSSPCTRRRLFPVYEETAALYTVLYTVLYEETAALYTRSGGHLCTLEQGVPVH